jgi:photosystem II stability/assembly factor-like uncharacterized protein
MRGFTQKAALATLVAVFVSDALAQSRPSTAVAEWRSPIPKSEVSGELYGVEFLNHNIGWAVGGQSGTKSTMLYGTKDGGKTWERLTLFDGELSHLTDIGFADANNGWIVGRDQVLRTTDGGESWGPVNQPERGSYGAHKLLVLGPDAIIVGSDVENAQILRTVDGGGTWEVIALVKDGGGGAGSNNTVSGLALAEPSTVFATTGTRHGSRGVIYRSNDGGRTWEVVEEADRPLLGIAFHGKRGVAVGVNIAFWTADGGNTWSRVAIPGNQYAVDFVDDNTVVAVGDRPHVVISRNGGKTWQPLPAPLDHGNLVDIAAVDAGWWFVAGGYGARALYHYVDPNHTEPIARGTIPLPVDVQVPGGKALPRGLYDVTMGHRGDEHVVKLERKGEVPADGQGSAGGQASASGQAVGGNVAAGAGATAGGGGSAGLEGAVEKQKGQKPPACAQPCVVTLPVGVTYEKENVTPGAGGNDPKSFFFRINLEPTPTGVAVVVRTAVTPPRNIGLALAAVAAPQSSEGEVQQVAKKAAAKGGGLFGRIQKAASGDVKGAVAGAVNPRATQQRLRAAKSAPPAVYKVTVRHTLDLFGGTQGARAP